MRWFRERSAAFDWAKGHRVWLSTAGILFLVAAGTEIWPQFREQLSDWVIVPASNEEGGMTILGHPAWSIFVILGLLFLCAWLFESIVLAHKERSPKFSVSYDNVSWSFRKPILLTPDGGKTFEKGISIRAQIQCESLTAVEQCSGFLTKVEYKPVGGAFSEIPIYEPNKLPWALEEPIEFTPVSIFPRVPKYLGICLAEETKNSFNFRTNVRSYAAPCEFKDVGEYKFHVEVVAQHCVPVSRIFLIQWNGKWDEIQACLVENT